MICKKCNKEHDGSYGSGKFCSRQCANSRQWTEQDKLKKSISAINSEKVKEATKEKFENIDFIKKLKESGLRKKHLADKLILESNFNDLSLSRIKRRILLEQNHKCNKCGIDKWLGEQITLELEHKDGNRDNNIRENLECLCPNCHSQTNTWRGRNNKKGNSNYIRISDEVLIKSLIKNNGDITKTLKEHYLAPKGGNYKRCNILKKMLTT